MKVTRGLKSHHPFCAQKSSIPNSDVGERTPNPIDPAVRHSLIGNILPAYSIIDNGIPAGRLEVVDESLRFLLNTEYFVDGE